MEICLFVYMLYISLLNMSMFKSGGRGHYLNLGLDNNYS